MKRCVCRASFVPVYTISRTEKLTFAPPSFPGHVQYYDMAKYEIKMRMIRTGESMNLVVDGGYDPNADLAAHSNSLKVGRHPV